MPRDTAMRAELRDVSLRYRLARQRFSSVKDYAIHWMKGSLTYEELWALRGVNLRIDAAEFLGVIGRNGAGKSTLLKVLSGVLEPTGGRLAVTGSVTPLLELGTGFDFELTGRENIFLNALLLGHTRSEIKRELDAIVDFSELGHFIDSPIRNYSTGMLARLAFSIATAWTPELLIVDEVLSVGDVAFTRKCEVRMREFRSRGVTTILVTHDGATMIENCTRCVWLDGGRIAADGAPEEVWRRYSAAALREAPPAPPEPSPPPAAPGAVAPAAASAAPATRGPSEAPPRVLHLTHSLGGGIARWLELFFDGARAANTVPEDSAGATAFDHLVLRSIGTRARYGAQLWLCDDPRSNAPLEVHELATAIPATATDHSEYREVLDGVIRDHGVSAVVVSSLVGHSLDALATGLPTLLVCHDYYPACPAVHAYFGGICSSCEPERLAACFAENPLNHLFEPRDAGPWLELRGALFDRLRSGAVYVVAPSPSVEDRYKTIFPELDGVEFAIVPHAVAGGRERAEPPQSTGDGESRRLRIVVPGRLGAAKGAALLRSVLDRLLQIADLHLIGCGEGWNDVRARGVEVVPHYEPGKLGELLAHRRPDLVLLLSIVPETWSFTLEECMVAGVPALATRVGSFVDRIEDGTSGFLCDPDAEALLARLAELDRDRAALRAVRARLAARPQRTAAEMVGDYTRLFERARDLPRDSQRTVAAATPNAGQRSAGVRLPPGSPLGFTDFLRQVEAGTYHHLNDSPRLGTWSRRFALAASRSGFRLLQWVAQRW